jgi:hypothetical protein
VSTLTAFTSVEQPVRDWLRTQAITNISTRVYVGLPSDATFPAVEVTLLDGGIQAGEAPVANAMFSFSVWGSLETRTETTAAAFALASLLHTLRAVDLDDDLVLHSAQVVLGPVPRFDGDGTPRYVIDAALTLVKVA